MESGWQAGISQSVANAVPKPARQLPRRLADVLQFQLRNAANDAQAGCDPLR